MTNDTDRGPDSTTAEEDDGETAASASPLTEITGLLTDEEADRAEAKQREWRKDFETEIGGEL